MKTLFIYIYRTARDLVSALLNLTGWAFAVVFFLIFSDSE